MDKAEALQKVLDGLEREVEGISTMARVWWESMDRRAGERVDLEVVKTMLGLVESLAENALEHAYAAEERITGTGAPQPALAQPS